MECPHCHNTLPSQECPQCGEQVPLEGKFCCHCAAALPERHADDSHGDHPDPDDFAKRILCSDGTCIGVINKDGFCNECGKPYSGEPE